MEILYFVLPIVAILSVLWYAIRQISSAGSLGCRATPAVERSGIESDLRPSIEQRYVDWFTSESASRARDKADAPNDEEFLAGTGFMAGGKAYRPEFAGRRTFN